MGQGITEIDESYEIVTFGLSEDSHYRGQLGQLPFDMWTFDKLYITDTPICFENYIDEWKRILRPGGLMILNFPTPWVNLEQVKEYINKRNFGVAKTYNNCVEIRLA